MGESRDQGGGGGGRDGWDNLAGVKAREFKNRKTEICSHLPQILLFFTSMNRANEFYK